MDIDFILIFLFVAFGAFCLTLGYVLGMISKVAPLIVWIKSRMEDDVPSDGKGRA